MKESIEPRVIVEIHLDNLLHNLKNIKNLIPGTKIMAVVKTDAYGHGILEISKALDGKVEYFLVTSPDEALTLRENQIKTPILVLDPLYDDVLEELISKDIRITISNLKTWEIIKKISTQTKIKAHVKVDTGLKRLGFDLSEFKKFLSELNSYGEKLELEGIFTHLHSPEDFERTQVQIERFLEFCKILKKPITRHVFGTLGIFLNKNQTFEMVRPGIGLYGYIPVEELQRKFSLKPVMTIKTKVIFLRDVRKGEGIGYTHSYVAKKRIKIAVIPLGYADIIPWNTRNKGEVIIGGKRRRILGNVSMDYVMVEVDNSVKIGDEVVVIGEQSGERITALDWANWANTIPYEILVKKATTARKRILHVKNQEP